MAPESPLTFRRARPGDRERVAQLCAKIWEGGDYVPRCFDEWVADAAGEFTLCFTGDQLAGLSKLTWLAPGEAWLEGLRKDPDLPVKGVGSALCRRYLEHLASSPDLRSVRFSTYFSNLASIKLNEAMGFTCIATASFKEMRPEALQRRAQEPAGRDPRLVPVRDAAQALAFIRASGWFGPFLHQAWRSYPWSEDLFVERYLRAGHCLGVVEQGRLKALAACLVDPVKGEGALPFFDAEDPEAAALLLAAIEHRFAQEGVPAAAAIVPPGGVRACRHLDTLGWGSWEREEDYLIYELPLARLADYVSRPSHSA